jgi:hypothetical protein
MKNLGLKKMSRFTSTSTSTTMKNYDEGTIHSDLSIKTQVKLHPLEKVEDVGGHVFATCWTPIKKKDRKIHSDLNIDSLEKVYVCLKCRMELTSVALTIRDARVPDSYPLDTCDEFKSRQILES